MNLGNTNFQIHFKMVMSMSRGKKQAWFIDYSKLRGARLRPSQLLNWREVKTSEEQSCLAIEGIHCLYKKYISREEGW